MRGLRRIVGVLLAAALTAGCTDDDPPGRRPTDPGHSSTVPVSTRAPDPTPPVSSSPTTSHSAVRPTVPADVPTTGPNLRSKNERPPVEPLLATQHTQAGAKAFAKFFIQTIDWAYATTSTTYMRHYFNHQCVNCRNIANSVDLSRRRGHHFIGDRFTIRRSMAADPGARLVTVAVVFDVNAGEIVDSHGRYVDGLGALTAYREQVALSWLEDRWQVDAIRPLQ